MKRFIVPFLLLVFSPTLFAQSIPYGYNEDAGDYFDVGNDTKLYYEIYGEGKPLLMLHGGVYGYIDEYSGLIPKLAEKYKVICLATRGHVKSDIGHEPFTYDQRAGDAYKLIRHLGLTNVTVIGFSDGGFSAYKLAALYPDVIEKMVVMGAGDQPGDGKREEFSYSSKNLMDQSGDYFKRRVENMPEPDRWEESLTMLNDLYNNSVVSKETFGKIQCPVLVLAGDRDQYFKLETIVSAYQEIPSSFLSIIPGCDHVIFFCNFPAVWESMKPFLGYDN